MILENKWRTIEDELHTPHKEITFDVGNQSKKKKKTIIDQKKFNWKNYEVDSKSLLENLAKEWSRREIPVESMVEQLKKLMEDLTQKIAVKKTITSHSKPWISNEISEIFKELRGTRDRVNPYQKFQR